MEDLSRLGKRLNYVFAHTIVLRDGSVVEQRELVSRIDGLKIEIYPNEHPPPHFHVVGQDMKISVHILSCEILHGSIDHKRFKKLQYFHKLNKTLLIKTWNKLRPTNCQVGEILE